MNRIVQSVKDLCALTGSFVMPTGEVEKTEDGYCYAGEGYTWQTKESKHPSGVIERSDVITNTSDVPITLNTVLSKFVFHGGEYEVYTQYSEWCRESVGAWQPLVTEVCASNDDLRMNSGANPFVAIWNEQNQRGMAFHIMADSKWCYRVKRNYEQTRPRHRNVWVELGAYDRSFSYELEPGESLVLPKILYYPFQNKLDMDAYKLHRYCNDVFPARSMPIIYNSWLSRGDQISYELLAEQLEEAVKLGVEYFVIDAGWFGAPGQWYDCVGDWRECKDCSMMGRMREFADLVREKGLKFGLWFEIERAACAAKTVAANPQYYLTEDGNCFIDFSNPEACEFIYQMIAEQIRLYGIEFIKFDFNAPITYDKNGHAFMEYFKGYRAVIDRMHEEFPTLYFENCASGGTRMALSNLRGFDSFWMSDSHSLYVQLEVFKNTLLRMPSRALERWITIQTLPCIKGRSREKILVSDDSGWGLVEAVTDEFLRGATVGGPIGISCELTSFSDSLRQSLSTHIAQYKEERDFWMHSECRILTDTPTMLVLQFSDASLSKLKIVGYAKDFIQTGMTVYPVCRADAVYKDANGVERTGADLYESGIEFAIEQRYRFNSFSTELQTIQS